MAVTTLTTLQGLNVVITGKIPGETRPTAEAKVAAAGAHVQKAVTRATDVLICGADVGRVKTDKARRLGVKTITWLDAVALMRNPGSASVREAEPPPATARNQPVRPRPGYRQVQPMLCKLRDVADGLPPGDDWLYEVKWDGYRCVAHVDANGVILASRSGKDFTARFPRITAELEQLPLGCILDGEIAFLDEEGRSQFQALHGGDDSQAKYLVWDLLALEADGTTHDIRSRPLAERRELLERLLEDGGLVTVSPAFDDGQALLDYALANDLEGIVAKRKSSVYKENGRTEAWQKIKVRLEQEFVVVGYTEGKGARAGTAGALLLATWGGKTKGWQFHGSAGSGGTYEDFQEIVSRTTPLGGTAQHAMVHDLSRAELREVTWVQTEVVVQVRFQRWTDDGKLWHPSIKGIREDKDPYEVRRET